MIVGGGPMSEPGLMSGQPLQSPGDHPLHVGVLPGGQTAAGGTAGTNSAQRGRKAAANKRSPMAMGGPCRSGPSANLSSV